MEVDREDSYIKRKEKGKSALPVEEAREGEADLN